MKVTYSTRVLSQDHLIDEERPCHENGAGEVGNDSGGTSVLANDIREAPYIANADGIAQQGEDVGHAAHVLFSIVSFAHLRDPEP